MATDIAIRRAKATDAAACSTVPVASIRDLCVADHHGDPQTVARWTANKTPETVARWISDPHRFYLAAGWQDAGATVSAHGIPGRPMRKTPVSKWVDTNGAG